MYGKASMASNSNRIELSQRSANGRQSGGYSPTAQAIASPGKAATLRRKDLSPAAAA